MKKSELREIVKEVIRKVGDEYAVYPEKGGKRLGTHSSREKAEKQLTAIHLNKEAYEKGKVIIYHNFQGVDVDENVPGTNKVLNIADCIGNEPAKDYNYFTTEKKQYVEDMVKDAAGEGWKKFPPVLAIPHPLVSSKYSVIDGNHRLGAFTIGKIPQINARILSDDKILLAERGAEWDENKLPKTMPLADARKKRVNLKEYFATQPLKVPSNENYAANRSPLEKLVNDYLFLITSNFVHIEETGKTPKDVDALTQMIKHAKSDVDTLTDLSKEQLEKNRNNILQRIHDMLTYIISRMKAHMRPEEYEKRRGRLNNILTLYKKAASVKENYADGKVKGKHDPMNPGILKKRLGKLSCSKVRAERAKLKDKGTTYAKALQRYLNYHCQ